MGAERGAAKRIEMKRQLGAKRGAAKRIEMKGQWGAKRRGSGKAGQPKLVS